MSEQKNKIIVIVGTNASGKTSLSIALAKQHNGEVISADSRQVYRGLDLASGKVTSEEMVGVPHHLIDVVEPTEVYTAADFARDGREALHDILEHSKLPIVAGGTGFYIDALLNPGLLASVPANDEMRAELEERSVEDLFAQLQEVDPRRATDLRAKGEDTLKRRVIRAIEVAVTPSTDAPQVAPLPDLDILWVGIEWDNDVLKERIRARAVERVNEGMLEEAQKLHENGLSFERMEELGLECKHLADYLRERITKDELTELVARDAWRYAKRQRTWFKRNQDINWFEGDKLEGVEELVERFLQKD